MVAMSNYTENFRLAAVAAASAWTHAAGAIDHARWAEYAGLTNDAVRSRRHAEHAALAGLDATKFSDRAYLEGNPASVKGAGKSAQVAYTIALRAADAAEASAKKSA